MDTIQDVLIYQTQMMRNSSLGPYVPADFSPPEYIVVVNALFYASLGVMILAAFIAMMIISWVHEFDHGLGAISLPEQRATTREFRYLGMERWKLQEMVAMLPLLIQTSLLLFAIGLVLFLFNVSKPSFGITTAIFGVGVLYYAVTTTISIFVTSSPFHSPLSRALGKVYRRLHAYFCSDIYEFIFPKIPATPLGRLRQRIQIFLLKFRPYSEGDLAVSIRPTTLDEVQLYASSSALERIHNMPNLQHGELVQQSVWQVLSERANQRVGIVIPFWIFNIVDDTESISRLPPEIVVLLKASMVLLRFEDHMWDIMEMEKTQRALCNLQGPWFQIMHAISDLLPNQYHFPDHPSPYNANVRHILRIDALLCEALPSSPELDALRDKLVSSILNPEDIRQIARLHTRRNYFWHALYHNTLRRYPRVELLFADNLFDAFREAFREAPLRVLRAFLCDALFGNSRFNHIKSHPRVLRVFIAYREPDVLINTLREYAPRGGESVKILGTLSGFHCTGLVQLKRHVSKICLAILSHRVQKWYWKKTIDFLLLNAVVSFSSICCSSNEAYQIKTLKNWHQYPWLFVNLRNTDLIRRIIEEADDSSRKELISLFLLVTYGLIQLDSRPLAELYLGVITATGDFALWASALAVSAPCLHLPWPYESGLLAIIELLVVARTQFLASRAGTYTPEDMSDFPQQFTKYGRLLEASETSDPNIAAILLLLSKGMPVREFLLFVQTLRSVATSHDSPDGNSMDIRTCRDHRVHNMFGALSLLLCPYGATIYELHGQFPFLSSFLEASDPAISCPVLHHYMEMFGTVITPPPRRISDALRIVFNPILPGHHIPRGWIILNKFLHIFNDYPAQWRQIFAEAFFSQSRRALLKESREKGAPGSIQEVSNILTWQYFCEEEPEHKLSDGEFNGLDWMAMAWSLHLSQRFDTKVTVAAQEKKHPPSDEEHWLNEQFVLQVLCRLLEAAQYHSIIPVIPRLREFLGWFDESEHFSYKSEISVKIEEAVRDQEWKMLYNFEKLHCTWSI